MQKDEQNHRRNTTLTLALSRKWEWKSKSKSSNNNEDAVALKLMEIGGKELVMERDNWGFTAFEIAQMHNASFEVISKMIEIGGKELVMDKDAGGSWSALKIACIHDASIEVVSILIDIGGKEMTMDKEWGFSRNTALHCACENEASIEVISKLIEIGGKELVMKKNTSGLTALHYACGHNAPTAVVSKLIEVGGKDVLIEKNELGQTALHYAYFNMFLERDENKFDDDNFFLLVKEGISAQMGGEFGIGGLFSGSSKGTPSYQQEAHMQYIIYHQWKDFAPYLEKIMASSFQDHDHQPPILHAALIAKAPENIIQDIVNRFKNCILTRDTINRYPIDVAVELGLQWENGMEVVVKAMAAVMQQRPIIYVAAQHGLQWDNHMREIVQSSIDEVRNGQDIKTGLLPFMLAAAGDHFDLNCIYELIKMNPVDVCAISKINNPNGILCMSAVHSKRRRI